MRLNDFVGNNSRMRIHRPKPANRPSNRGAGAIYPGGARAPSPTFESGGGTGGTGLEELQTPGGKLTI